MKGFILQKLVGKEEYVLSDIGRLVRYVEWVWRGSASCRKRFDANGDNVHLTMFWPQRVLRVGLRRKRSYVL